MWGVLLNEIEDDKLVYMTGAAPLFPPKKE